MKQMKKKMNVLSGIICFLLSFLMLTITVGAESYTSYVYDADMNTVPSPTYYAPADTVYGKEIMGSEWNSLADIACIDERIAVLDNGKNGENSCVYLLDTSFQLIRTIQFFDNNGKEDSFKNAQGIFLTKDAIYVADTGNGRILSFNYEGVLLKEFGRPQTELLSESLVYQPQKVAVDDAARLYVVATSVNQGLIELESDGSFLRYMGANAVRYNLIEYFWRSFSTDAQLERMDLFVPTEYTNLSIDEQGFVFAVNGAASNNLANSDVVKRLNPKGNNVIKQNGYVPPVGDILNGKVYSVIVDVDVHPSGVYALLDSISGRVFLYDSDGNMLSAFGGTGEQEGLTQVPKAICYCGDRLLVVDDFWKAILVYDLTPYGQTVQSATALYEEGAYEQSIEQWEKVLQYNANSDLAYVGIGKVALRLGDYGKASKYFRLSEQRSYYSKAYKQQRREQMGVWFPYVAAAIVVIVVIILIVTWVKKSVVLLRKLSVDHENQ